MNTNKESETKPFTIDMKREILFKAKTIDTNKWIEGLLVDYNKLVFLVGENAKHTSVCPETVCQYIGKKDKSGVNIFEGDYLVDEYPIDEEDLSKGYNKSLLPVTWCKEQLMWCVDASFKKNGSFLTSLVDYFDDLLEVEGNIHDNEKTLAKN